MPDAPSPTWSYDPRSKRYRDNRNGRYLSLHEIVRLRDRYITAEARAAYGATLDLMEGRGSLSSWSASMQQAIKTAHGAAFLLGRGGTTQPTEADWRQLGRTVLEQYHYLERFTLDLAAGSLTPRQAAARAALYLHNVNQSYSRGYAIAWGDLRLPAYPADGSMICKSRCKCFWRIERANDGVVEAFWIRGGEDSCLTCIRYAGDWNPYTIPARTLEV